MKTILALDTSSPTTSVALRSGSGHALRTIAQKRSSKDLLSLIHQCLEELHLSVRDLDGLVALRGPGSFTGLRIGLATAYGLHQSLDIPAVAVSTLKILALSVPSTSEVIGTAVDAIRGEWFVQRYQEGRALEQPLRLPASEVASERPAQHWVGFGLDRILNPSSESFGPPSRELAEVAAHWAQRNPVPWDASTLLAPHYLRAPLINPPGAPKRVRR